MVYLDTILTLFVVAILVLPWTFKQAGLWDRIKKWYKIVLTGFVLTLIPTVVSLYVSTWQALAFINSSASYQYFLLGLEGIAVIIIVIGFIGILKELVSK